MHENKKAKVADTVIVIITLIALSCIIYVIVSTFNNRELFSGMGDFAERMVFKTDAK